MIAFAEIYATSPDWMKFLWWLVFGVGPFVTTLLALRMLLRFRLQRETLRQRAGAMVRARPIPTLEGPRD
ncbi:MAG: hypothetical protein AAFR27_07225 [Pseudomonadota bacterium]